jgi:hypothetical protein
MHSTTISSLPLRLLRSTALLCIVLTPLPALAQNAVQATPSARTSADGYGYYFPEDKLAGDGFGPSNSVIRVRTGALRQTLIRPRTNFVPELLKTVENL